MFAQEGVPYVKFSYIGVSEKRSCVTGGVVWGRWPGIFKAGSSSGGSEPGVTRMPGETAASYIL